MPDPSLIELSCVRHLFPSVPATAFVSPPTSQIKMLIGNNFLSLHPRGGNGKFQSGNLRVLQNNFGTGWVLAGAHPFLSSCESELVQSTVTIARVNRLDV